jgi:hypothetical protein
VNVALPDYAATTVEFVPDRAGSAVDAAPPRELSVATQNLEPLPIERLAP